MAKRTAAILLVAIVFVMVFATASMAQEEEEEPLGSDVKSFIALACGLSIAVAVLGGALGQGRASAAALEGIARNPGASSKIFSPMILGLALIESLVIYALIISFILVGKL